MTPGFTQLKTQINQFCLIDGERVEAIRLYITGTKFRNITGDPELTDVQVLIITELLDEMSPKGVFKEFNSEKCNEISEQNLRQTRRFPKSIMDIYGRGRQRSMASVLSRIILSSRENSSTDANSMIMKTENSPKRDT